MTENQSADPFDKDPFDADPFATESPVEDTVPDDVLNELDDIFGDADFDMGEEESEEAVKVRDAGTAYDNPLDVGILDRMWVPIRLSGVTFKEKHKTRRPSKTCVAVKTGEDGRKRVYIPYDKAEAAMRTGATEVIAEMELPYFIAEGQHVTPEFGQRRWPYDFEVPALTVKTAYPKGPKGERTGFKNEDGPSLRKASGATRPGEQVTLATMPDIATRMEDQIVMGQIYLSSKTKVRPRLDTAGQPISVLISEDTGLPVTVFTPEDGSGYIVNGTGEVWDGDPKLLIRTEGRLSAIHDTGELSAPLMENYTQVTDYINAPFLPVPDRAAEVEMASGDVIHGEVTWKTVGAIVHGKVPGIFVDVLLKTGRTVTAVWLGTQWNEVVPEGGTGGGLDEFSGLKNL